MAPSTLLVAETAEQAHLLLDTTYLGLIYLLQREAHASHLATLTGRLLRQVHHQLTRLLNAQLIEVTGLQRRAGRPIKLYRATATHFQVPFHLMPHPDLRAVLGHLFALLSEASAFYLARLSPALSGSDLRIELLESDDGVIYSLAPPLGAEPHLDPLLQRLNFQEVRLSRPHQEELARRIDELHGWIVERQRLDQPAGTAEPCLVSLMSLPASPSIRPAAARVGAPGPK